MVAGQTIVRAGSIGLSEKHYAGITTHSRRAGGRARSRPAAMIVCAACASAFMREPKRLAENIMLLDYKAFEAGGELMRGREGARKPGSPHHFWQVTLLNALSDKCARCRARDELVFERHDRIGSARYPDERV